MYHAMSMGGGAKFTRWGPGASKLRPQPYRVANAALGQMCHDVVHHQPALAAALRAVGLLDCFEDEDEEEEEEGEEEGEEEDEDEDEEEEEELELEQPASTPPKAERESQPAAASSTLPTAQ